MATCSSVGCWVLVIADVIAVIILVLSIAI